MDDQTKQLIDECKRQEESCLWTSTTFFEWLKSLRTWRVLFIAIPLILGGVASIPLINGSTDWTWLTAICTFGASVIPAIYKALGFDRDLKTIAGDAHRFKILQDRFRQTANITSLAGFDGAKAEFDHLMKRMDAARENSHTAPERFFKKAKKKIEKNGHYTFLVDSRHP